MLERDEYGYVLKIVSNFPYHPWWRLTAQLVEGFRDQKKTGLVSSGGIYSPKFGLGSFENPKMIGSGQVDAGIINPPVTARLAMEGKGPYKERVGELRAIARFPEPVVVGVPLVRNGAANAIFQEGQHHPMWEQLAEARPLRCLVVSRGIVDYMMETYGFSEAIIPKGRLKGVEEDVLTLDYGGWLLACREDLPAEVAYLLAQVCTDQRDAVAAPYKDKPKHLQSFEIPITPQHLSSKCVIPLHKGAEKYYRESGCL